MPMIRAIDADGHVQEPAVAWETHLDARYRALAPRVLRDDQGRVRQMIGGELKPYIRITSYNVCYTKLLRFVGRPVGALMDQARRIGSGDFSARLDLQGADELSELARA